MRGFLRAGSLQESGALVGEGLQTAGRRPLHRGSATVTCVTSWKNSTGRATLRMVYKTTGLAAQWWGPPKWNTSREPLSPLTSPVIIPLFTGEET